MNFADLLRWNFRLIDLRPRKGFDRWHLRGRPRTCRKCGKRLLWRCGRQKDGKLYRVLACMSADGGMGESGHERFEWTSDEEYGRGPFEE